VNNRLVDDAKAKASARSHLPMTLYLCFCAVLEDSAASARAQREHIEGTEGFTAAEREAALRRVRSSGDLEGGGRVEGRQRREELSVGCSRRCPPLPLMHMRKRLRTRLPGPNLPSTDWSLYRDPSMPRDPSMVGLPAGAPTELYRGPRYQKPETPAPPPGPPVFEHVPVNMQRVRAISGRPANPHEQAIAAKEGLDGSERMVFDAARGGWVQPIGAKFSNQPSPIGEHRWTRWSPDTGARNPNVKAAHNSSARAFSSAPAGTYDGVAARPAPSADKYARGVMVRPWSPPPMEAADPPSKPTVHDVPRAPGTAVPMRGGSWPVDTTVR